MPSAARPAAGFMRLRYEAALSCAEYYITTLSSTKVQPTLPQLLKAYLAAVPLEEEQREEALTLLQKSKD